MLRPFSFARTIEAWPQFQLRPFFFEKKACREFNTVFSL
jgi:hypothetical protein